MISALIEAHGQGGSGYFDKDWPYHNSFLIADRARRVRARDVGPSLGRAARHRRRQRQQPSRRSAATGTRCRPTPSSTRRAKAGGRSERRALRLRRGLPRHRAWRRRSSRAAATGAPASCSTAAAARSRPASLRTALRDHYDGTVHRPGRTIDDERYFSVCMHAEPVGTTTASMIARIAGRRRTTCCATGAASARRASACSCRTTSTASIPAVLARGGEHPSDDSPWWQLQGAAHPRRARLRTLRPARPRHLGRASSSVLVERRRRGRSRSPRRAAPAAPNPPRPVDALHGGQRGARCSATAGRAHRSSCETALLTQTRQRP